MRIFIVFICLLALNASLTAQVAINQDNSAPDPSAMLDVKSSDKGMLVPRMNTGQRTMIVSPATGLLVFDTDTESFWFHDSNGWVELLRGWSLKGNAGTDTTVNFIGTTDNMPLDFRVNNERALRLEYAQNGPGNTAPNIIGGYSGNTVSPGKAGATISGGGLPGNPNIVTNSFATIAGGGANTASGDGATISGGAYHIASGVSSTIGGGYGNDASGGYSTIGGGSTNDASGENSTIGGGNGNEASGENSMVPGGLVNRAYGDCSFAAGRRATANHNGTFVWADNTNANFSSTAEKQFLIRAGNGVGINKNNPATALDVNGTATATAFVGDGSALTGIPDDQMLSLSGTTLSIENGNAVNLAVLADNLGNHTATQTLDLGGNDISNGGTVTATAFAGDGSALTGIPDDQRLNLSGTTLSIEDGNSVNLANLPNWSINGNAGMMDGTNFIGTTDYVPLDFRVNNERALRLEYKTHSGDFAPNVIGGYSGNTASSGSAGATIGGGGYSIFPNTVLGDFGTISGGLWNTASNNASTIGGGSHNTASSGYSTIGGGIHNAASGMYSMIGGGYNNATSGTSPTIGGGYTNDASGGYSTIGGGYYNTASGKYSMVPGGESNRADGDNSFAAGQKATANHNGTFVWADDTNTEFASTDVQQFLIRAGNGVGINKNNPATALDVNGTVTATAFAGDGSGLTNLPGDNLGNHIATQTLDLSGNDVTNGGTVTATAFVGDGSGLTGIPDNQTLSLSGSTLSIEDGNSVDLAGLQDDNLGNHTATQNVNLDGNYLSGDGDNEGVFVDGDGEVGIGTTTPTEKLHIQDGNAKISQTMTETASLTLEGHTAAGNQRAWSISTESHPVLPDGSDLAFSRQGSEKMRIDNDGNVGIGTNDPANKLEVRASVTGGNGNANTYVAKIRNTNTNAGLEQGLLALQFNADLNGNGGNGNWIQFFENSTDLAGKIENNNSGDVQYQSGGSDYAEMLERLDHDEKIKPGDVVGVFGGKISKRTDGADWVMTISDQAVVLGNAVYDGTEAHYEITSFIGQVPVWVSGKVSKGDFILASGKNDGTAIAVSPQDLQPEQGRLIVGRAWENKDTEEVARVNTVVGLPEAASTTMALVKRVEAQQAEIAMLKAQNQEMLNQNATFEKRFSRLETALKNLNANAENPNSTRSHLKNGAGDEKDGY